MVESPYKEAGFIELVRKNFQEVGAYKNLSDRYQDVDVDNVEKIENNITGFLAQQYELREKILQSKGVKIPDELLFLGNLHPSRVQGVDALVAQYNQDLYDGQDPLKLSEQIIELAKQNVLSPDLQGYDFENAPWYKRFGAALVGGLAGEALYHPVRFLGGLALTVGLSSAVAPARLAALGLRGRSLYLASKGLPLAIEAVSGGAQAAIAVNETNKTLGIINEEEQSLGEAFATGAALTAGFAGAAAITRVGIKKGFNALSKDVEYAAIGSMPPEARATYVDDIVRYNPNSVFTETEEAIVNNDIRRLTTSVEENNLADYNAVWAEDKGNMTVAQGAEELYQQNYGSQPDNGNLFFEAAANSSEVQKRIDNIQANAYFDNLLQKGENYAETYGLRRPGDQGFSGFLQEFADFAKQTRKPSGEAAGASGTATGAANANAGPGTRTGIGGPELAALENNVINSFIETKYPETYRYSPSIKNSLDNAIRDLFSGDLPVPDTYFSPAQLNNLDLSGLEKALNYNKQLTRAKFAETVLSTPNSVEGRILNFEDAIARVRYRYNALIENQESIFRQKGLALKNDMQDLLTKAYKTSDIAEINWPKVVDQILRPVEADGSVEASIAFRTRSFFKDTLEDIGANGCYLGEADSYFPNNFSPTKTVHFTAQEFVNDMTSTIDLPRLEATARSKGVNFTSAESFFEQTYKNICIDRASYKVASSGDVKFAPYERYLFFKDGDAWTRMHDKYGVSSNFFDVLDSVKNRLENSYLRSVIGAESSAEVSSIITPLVDSLAEKILEQNPKAFGSNYKSAKTNFTKQMIDTIATQHNYLNAGSLPRGIASYVSFKKGVLVSGAVIPNAIIDQVGAIPTLSNMLFSDPTTLQRNALLPLFEQATQRLFNKASASRLDEIITFSTARRDAFIKELRTAAESIDSPLRQSWDLVKGKAKAIAELPQKTMNQVARVSEATSVLGYQRSLYKMKGKTFAELSQGMRNFFEYAGIVEKDWDLFRQLPEAKFGGKTSVQSARYLLSQGIESEVIEKFALAETMVSLFGSVRGTRFGAAGSIRPGASRTSQILAATASPFQNITTNAFNIHGRALIELLKNKRITAATANMSMLIFSGWLAYMAKEYSRGNKPNPAGADAFSGALVYSGLLSEGGEFMLSTLRGGWSNDGFFPEIAAIGDITTRLIEDKPLNLYSTMTKLSKGINPLKNYPLLGVVTNKYLASALFSLIDPEGAALYEERVEKNYRDGKLTPYGRWANTPAELPNRLTADQVRRRRRTR